MAAANLVFVGDVGGPQTYHVGDEAMMDANLALFRRIVPGLDATVVSADPAWTAAQYCVKSVPRPTLSHATDGDCLDTLLDNLLADQSLQAGPALEAVAKSDGLVISGGGNLSSNWPAHVLERAVLAGAARRQNLPVIVLGQTIGPDLSSPERELVSRMLRCADWVGVREAPSYALALELGVAIERLSYQLDDAIHLPPERPVGTWVSELVRDETRPWIAVTVHPVEDPDLDGILIKALATELRTIAGATQARIVFIPHSARPRADGWSDHAVGRALARHLDPGCMMVVDEGLSARHARWLSGQAEFVVSTRYHPVVFGLAAGVPCLGIWTDDYTRSKLEGALSHAGRVHDTCNIWGAMTGQIASKALALWDERAQTRIELAGSIGTWHERERCRADALAEMLRSGVTPAGNGTTIKDEQRVLIGHLAGAVLSACRVRDRAVKEMTDCASALGARANLLERSLAAAREGAAMGTRERVRRQAGALIRRIRSLDFPGS
jgi:polysaccharide pyruvyl transferase WcaK-like protein